MFKNSFQRMICLAASAGLCLALSPVVSAQAVDAQAAAEKEAGAAGQPNIEVEAPSHQFGEVWSGSPVEHTYKIRNTGDAVLKITRVKPSCGCTVARDYDREIPPGGEGKIPISINTSKLRSKVSKSVTVQSNDPDNGTMRLTIGGTVKQRFEIDPPRAGNFGRVKPSEKVEQVLTLTNNMDTPQTLSLEEPQAGLFTAELSEITPGQVYQMTIRADKPLTQRINRASFKLTSAEDASAKVAIPVMAFVPDRLEVVPKQLIIPAASTTPSERQVRVRFNAEKPYEVTSATVDAANVEAEVVEQTPGQYNVKLSLPANYMPPVAGHTLTLNTDDPENPEVEVKIAQRRAARRRPQRPALQLAGKPVPDASFEMVDGSTFTTKEAQGDVTLLTFYASWCGFCKRALPKVDELAQELGNTDKPFRALAVSLDTIKEFGGKGRRARSKDQVVQQFKTMNLSLPQALDRERYGASRFKVTSFPTMFLLGKDGKVERVYVGGGAVNDGSLKKDVDALLSGKTLPEQRTPKVTRRKPRRRPAQELEGKNAPAATFAAVDGESIDTSDLDGKVTLLKFYASWCGYCKRALPKINELAKEMDGKDVRFVGVSQDTLIEDGVDPAKNRRARSKEFVVKQWNDMGLTFTQAFDPSKAGRNRFKVTSFPTMFLLGKDGKIEKVYMGGAAAMNGSLKKDIARLLEGKSLSGESADASGKAKEEALTVRTP